MNECIIHSSYSPPQEQLIIIIKDPAPFGCFRRGYFLPTINFFLSVYIIIIKVPAPSAEANSTSSYIEEEEVFVADPQFGRFARRQHIPTQTADSGDD